MGPTALKQLPRCTSGKTARELNLAESTLLAGIPKGPTYYSPYNHMKNAKTGKKLCYRPWWTLAKLAPAEASAAYEQLLPLKAPSERTTVGGRAIFSGLRPQCCSERAGN